MYTISVFLHLILVAFWIGGMLFTAAVLVPVSRDRLFRDHRAALFRKAGTIFSRVSWVIFPALILTGWTALLGMGYATSDLLSADFWRSPYGGTLMGKLHLFGLVLVVSGIHDFWLGPRAVDRMESDPDSVATHRYRKASSWVGRINLLLGLAILWYAIHLVR